MSEELAKIGAAFIVGGIVATIANPHLAPILQADLRLWGVFIILLGVVILGARLREMAT